MQISLSFKSTHTGRESFKLSCGLVQMAFDEHKG